MNKETEYVTVRKSDVYEINGWLLWFVNLHLTVWSADPEMSSSPSIPSSEWIESIASRCLFIFVL